MKTYGETINTPPIEELYDDLKHRIDKAIEYISDYEDYCDDDECDCTPAYFKELLDILKGSDKDE